MPKNITIDKQKFEALCHIQATKKEIAYVMQCHEDTIERWCKRTYKQLFGDVWDTYSAGGKMSLRRKMYETAMGGNVTMMIWLSKQYLAMTDKLEQKEAEEKKPNVVYKAEWDIAKEQLDKPDAHS